MALVNQELDLMSEITYILVILVLIISLGIIINFDIKEKKLAKRNEDGTKNKNRGLSLGIIVTISISIVTSIILLFFGNEVKSNGRTVIQVLTVLSGLCIIVTLIMTLLKAKNSKFQYQDEKAQKMIAILLPFLGGLAGLAFGYFTGLSDCATELEALKAAVRRE